MAAGDIIIPDNTLTVEIQQQLFANLRAMLEQDAKDPNDWEEVSSLVGVSSLPVFQVSGGVYRLVRVAVSILHGTDGREVELQVTATHIQWRYTGGEWANLIALSALKGDKGETPTFRTGSTGIEWKYQSEADTAYKLLVAYDTLKLKFTDLTEEQKEELKLHFSDLMEEDIETLQQPAREAAETANQAAEAANTAAVSANEATEKAQSVSDHPGYIGVDYHVYVWDYATSAYKKTDTVLRPEAFSIYRTYVSIDEMNADLQNVAEGKFVLINTGDVENPDNAKLYVRGASSFEYLVDMSGAIGFTGKTPDLSIGTVTEGGEMAVTISPDGTDDDGNPKYKLNFVIRRGPQGFTPLIEIGTVTTGLPGTDASAEIVDDGTTEEGAPKKKLNLTVPRGDTGSVDNVYLTREIDHIPTETDLTYQDGEETKAYPIGAEVYYRESPDADAEFYKLYNITDGKAVWDKSGKGGGGDGIVYPTFEIRDDAHLIANNIQNPDTFKVDASGHLVFNPQIV